MADQHDTPTGGAPRQPKQSAKPEQRAQVFMPGAGGYELAGQGGKTAFKAPKKQERQRTPTATSPAKQSEALAETVMTSILDRLTMEAERKGGVLTVDDLQSMEQEFAKKTKALQTVFLKSFEDYVQAREVSAWEKDREYPFGRLLVSQFSHTFAGKTGHTLKDGAVSRRVIPGFFVGINMMLGPEFVEGAQALCRGIVDAQKAKHGPEFKSDHFYSDPDAEAILLDALVAVTGFFENAERRINWFIDIINSHIEPPKPEDMEGEEAEHWVIDEHTFRDVLTHLFARLRKALDDTQERENLALRHSHQTINEIDEILGRLL